MMELLVREYEDEVSLPREEIQGHLVIHNDKQPLVLETVSLYCHEIIDRVLEALNGGHVVQIPARHVPVEEALCGVQANDVLVEQKGEEQFKDRVVMTTHIQLTDL